MRLKKDIHFEVSERKILLRIADLIFVCFGLYILELFFPFNYLLIRSENAIYLFVLALYLSIFGTVFELYDLQKASKLDVTFRNIVLTVSTGSLCYFLTPYFTPFLPEQRLQIIYFYLTIIIMIFMWRLAYVSFVASPRFYKKVLLVGEISYVENIISALNNSDPNYKIVGFINCEKSSGEPVKFKGLKEFDASQLISVISEEKISEVLVASYNSETITSEIYHNLITLLEKGFTIREYTQVYRGIDL